MGRKDLLSAFWLLAALVIQTFELSESDRRHRRVLYLATLLCTCLALLSKIAAMTAFVVLALARSLRRARFSRASCTRLPGQRLAPCSSVC